MNEKVRIGLRCVGLGLLSSCAIGCGQYALAPGGKFLDWSMQSESFIGIRMSGYSKYLACGLGTVWSFSYFSRHSRASGLQHSFCL